MMNTLSARDVVLKSQTEDLGLGLEFSESKLVGFD